MALTMDQLNAVYNDMSVYGNTVAPMAVNNPSGLQITNKEEAPIVQPVIQSNQLPNFLNQGNDFNYANRNINYDNLIVPSLESEQKNNIFTNAINKFKSFGDDNKLLSGIMKAGSMIRDPITGVITSVIGMLPKENPMATATRNFYGKNFGLKSDNRIASGIMENYNPVYGSDFLNKISQGIIPESGYGLERAIDERMDNILNMLGDKYNYSYTNDKQMYEDMLTGKIGGYGIKGHTSAAENYFKMKAIKEGQARTIAAAAAAAEQAKKKTTSGGGTSGSGYKYETNTTGTAKTSSGGTYTQTYSPSRAATNRESKRGQQTRASKSKSSSNKSSGTNQGYSQHFKDGGIVTL